MSTFVNVIEISITISTIMALIVVATIKINTLMTGRIMNFLLNKKLLFKIALIIVIISSAFYFIFSANAYYWADLFWLAYSIGLIIFVAKYSPDLVLHLKKIHLSNLEDIEEQ